MKQTQDLVLQDLPTQRTLAGLSAKKTFLCVVNAGWDQTGELLVLTILPMPCLLCFNVLQWKAGRKYYTM